MSIVTKNDNKVILMPQENTNIEPNDEMKVWRYMDITKLISTLDKEALFFVRSDNLSDPSEGLLTKASIESWDLLLKEVHKEDPARSFVEQVINIAKNTPKKSKPLVYINSWHMNKNESMLMWSVYANSNKGVAIQSSLKKLKECLENSQCCYKEDFVKSPVIYTDTVDYIKNETFIEDFSHPDWNRNSFFKKPECFIDEREFRALIDLSSAMYDRLEAEYGFNYLKVIENGGIYIKVPIESLIEKIYVCPLAPNWILDVVKSIANKYGIGQDKVVRSSLVTGEFK